MSKVRSIGHLRGADETRSGQQSVGVIVASILMGGRPRILLLRKSGELWPISSHDIQFVMPASLVPAEVAGACWSPSILDTLNEAEDAEDTPEQAAEKEAMQEARRKVVMVIRRVMRETERMCGRMMGGVATKGRSGGVEAVWEKVAPENEEEYGRITAAEAAEYILNSEDTPDSITVRPNTLPAFAAHVLMMRRPDLFMGDEGDMWATGTFLVRSRAQRRRLEEVTRITRAETGGDKTIIAQFVEKARAAIEVARTLKSGSAITEHSHSLPAWTPVELDMISVILRTLYETRSTQESLLSGPANSLVKAVGAYPGEIVDRALFARFCQDIGAIRPWDSLRLSEAQEYEALSTAMAGPQSRGPDDLLRGDELDELRVDFSSHRVFVVDDASASELDDGLSVERIGADDFWLHVHIADPTRYIPPSHPLAIQASFRGSSMYLHDGRRPLLPLQQTMTELSLGAPASRPDGLHGVMTFSTRLGRDGVVRDTKVQMAWIKKPRIITYRAVDQALGLDSAGPSRPFGSPRESTPEANKDVDPAELEDLRLLRDLAMSYRSKRFATAGFDWFTPEASIDIVSALPPSPKNLFNLANLPSRPQLFDGFPLIDYTVPSAKASLNSNNFVGEFMILAGRAAAAFCHARDIPVPYRGLAPPQVAATAGRPNASLDDLLALRDPLTHRLDIFANEISDFHYNAGETSLVPRPHWTMGFDQPDSGYVRATSPLRRYGDLLVHWQIKSALAKERGLSAHAPALSAEDVGMLSARSDVASARAKRASKSESAYWQAGIIASRMGGPLNPDETVDLREPLEARIAGPAMHTERGTTSPVYVPSLALVVRLFETKRVERAVGQNVRARIVEASQWPNSVITTDLA